jgi:hypothetical protein
LLRVIFSRDGPLSPGFFVTPNATPRKNFLKNVVAGATHFVLKPTMPWKPPDLPEWHVWLGMISRCKNPNSPSYKYYGARGIRVADEWRGTKGFWRFYEELGPRPPPPPRLTIDRINNDGDYEPGNCRWATYEQQAGNKSDTIWMEHKGLRERLRDLADRHGLPRTVVYDRWHRGMREPFLLFAPRDEYKGIKLPPRQIVRPRNSKLEW